MSSDGLGVSIKEFNTDLRSCAWAVAEGSSSSKTMRENKIEVTKLHGDKHGGSERRNQ